METIQRKLRIIHTLDLVCFCQGIYDHILKNLETQTSIFY